MTAKIRTNRISASINYDKINRDFDIFSVSKKNDDESYEENNSYITDIVDISSHKINAVSVKYTNDNRTFILTEKDSINCASLKDEILRGIDKNYQDRIKICQIDIMNAGRRAKEFGSNEKILIELIFNSLMNNYGDKSVSYHNFTGHLFYRNKKWQKQSNFKVVI